MAAPGLGFGADFCSSLISDPTLYDCKVQIFRKFYRRRFSNEFAHAQILGTLENGLAKPIVPG